MKHTTFPWSVIKKEIQEPIDSPIIKLVDHVLNSGLSNYLHAATMLRNLRIGRSKNFSRNDGELTIEHIEKTDSVIFNYYESENAMPWQKTCKSEEIIGTFRHILVKRLRWVQSAEG